MNKNYRNLFTAGTALTVIATVVSPSVVSAAGFSDIHGNTHEEAIIQLVELGLINGYPDGTFKSNKDLTRSDVVKLIGKYLIANGFEIPSDYKTNIRFNDLSTSSNDELLQFAALVKDEGIFNGDQGKLSPAEKITRENMAVVLVNVLSKVLQFDFNTYVGNQSFNKEVKDLDKAKESARSAINVLDYYDVTKVNSFNPKETVTRGHFASFLYKLTTIKAPSLSVSQVEVLSKNQLFVTLSDQSTHTVTLEKSLIDNVPETVQFKIDGIQYSAVVEYVEEKGTNTPPDKEETDENAETSRFKVESDELLFGVTSDGRVVEVDDANIKVFGFIGEEKVELPFGAFNITTDSKYITINGKSVTANLAAIEADGILEDDSDQYEVEIVVTINESGETITHSLTLTREDVKANSKFELVDKNSISGKLLKDIDVELEDYDLELTTSNIFSEILEEGSFEMEDQYGNEVRLNGTTGEVIFFDGSTDMIRPIISEISTEHNGVISGNGTSSATLKLGENGLTNGDSFKLTLKIDEQSLSIRVYIK